MKRTLWVCVAAMCMATPAWAAEPFENAGNVDAVTVYRGQALVTRVVEVPGPAGLREVVVTDLPEHVVPGSIYAESANGVEVRSVRYRVRPVSEDVREEVRELDAQIRQLQDQIEADERHRQRLGEQKAYLDKLEQFIAATANVELTQGVLNAETLKDLTGFQFDQRKSIADEELRLGIELRTLNEERELLERRKNELASGSSRTAREAVVFANLQGDGGKLRVRYLVANATWSPSYNARRENGRPDVLIGYNASIQQMSGEDWTDVAMTLSTATPSLVSRAPELKPLTVTLGRPAQQGEGQASAKGDYLAQQRELTQQLWVANNYRDNNGIVLTQPAQTIETLGQTMRLPADSSGMSTSQRELDARLNELAGQLQNLDLMARAQVKRGKSPAPPMDEVVSVTYQLDGRTSLPSRTDQQLIQIAAVAMPADVYRLAVPVLTPQVYEEASVTNTGDRVLLAGPIATYVGGEFVGHGQVPTVAAGESFTVGFGIDASLRASRELVEKAENLQGGNRVVDLTYRLAIENFSDAPAAVRLLDRLPMAKDGEVKMTLASETESKLSENPAYRQQDRKKGLLRWDVEAPAKKAGPDAFAIEYSFRLEYDKEMTISGLALTQR